MAIRFIAFILFFFTLSVHAAQEITIPTELKGWVPWVLEGKEDVNCPFQYENTNRRHCAWPALLSLKFHSAGGSFKQNWEVYEESLIALPSSQNHWPQDVTVDGKPVVVSNENGVPHIQLQKGSHQLAGRFIWNALPESINLPKATGLIDVVIDKQPVKFPHFEASGRLWLNEAATQNQETVEDRLQVDVFRRIIDEVPLKVTTLLDLNVIGKAREIVLGPLFSNDYVPLLINGQLPMRLEVDGKLRMQVRPGHWRVEIIARHKTQVDSLSLMPSDLPDSEIWVFDARPSLRLVEIDGVPSIDPRQTRLPSQWQNLPTYRVTKQDTMSLITKRRGDPEPAANTLVLTRDLWLDFNGSGYTFQDQISGQMRNEWRLNMSSDMTLGRAVVNGVDQLVTRLKEGDAHGIEVRQGQIAAHVEGRYNGNIGHVPAAGWLANFSQVQATLHLPPGWRLFAASGADSVGGASWVDRWTLLDIFLVLIAALAVYRLLGFAWGGIAVACLVISWHESGAPQYIWLFVIAATALMRVAPEGRLRKSMQALRYLSLLALAVIAIPYMIDTVRTAIHPQLERPSMSPYQTRVTGMSSAPAQAPMPKLMEDTAEVFAEIDSATVLGGLPMKKTRSPISASIYSDAVDPRAKVQTGPGLPDWQWTTVPVRWNGPVQQGQTLGLTYIPPALTATLKVTSVILVLLLGLRLAGIALQGKRLTVEMAKLSIISLLVISPLSIQNEALAAEIPSQQLLKELQTRLLAPPECLPQCAQISRMKLDLQPEQIRILLEVHASENVAVPVPSKSAGWTPTEAMLDGQPNQIMRGPKDALWVHVPKGKHQIQIAGPIRPVRVLQLPLPLKPKHIAVSANGWTVKGVHQDGGIESALQIEREHTETQGTKPKVLEQTVLPSFVTVTRILRLGLEWQVETEVTRVSPPGSAIALDIPLISGESVTIRVANGHAKIQLTPQQRRIQWRSVLQPSESISLQAADSLDWIEQWRLDVSPIWHAELSGIPQIHHQSHSGTWYPQWHPWPGEQLTINVSKPTGVEGKTKTIDHTSLTVTPGRRATDVTLDMRLRSSQAEQHIIQIPADAVLSSATINGASQPIRQENDGIVRLPIIPGEQRIKLEWQTPTEVGMRLSTPQVNLALYSVNSNIEIRVPDSRWTLFTFGPQMGPAVLFWGVLIVVVIIAIGLGRTKQT
ncbi:hypothetical protein ACFL2V_15925, partial [Pseudomonadota bacterium]